MNTLLAENEYHPSADSAMRWYRDFMLDYKNYIMVREAIASTALSGNRLAELCQSTLDRLDKGGPVSDRYLLGLCWFLRELQDSKRSNPTTPDTVKEGDDLLSAITKLEKGE